MDQFIYGINPNPTTSSKYNLYRINGLGEVDNLGPISGVNGYKQAGAMGPNGEYYIYGFAGNFFQVDIATRTASLIGNFDFTVDDMAVSPVDGYIYTWKRQGRILIKIDPTTGTVEEVGSGNTAYAKFGSFMFNAQNEIIAYGKNDANNLQEALVKIDPSTGIVTPIGSGPITDDNDGCSCAYGLEMTKETLSSTVDAGSVLTYKFTIFNRSNGELTNITFNDVLTDGFLWNSEPQNVT